MEEKSTVERFGSRRIWEKSDYNDFRLSPDDRVLYLARSTEQGDIWLLTMK
jgi:hypothetical protein